MMYKSFQSIFEIKFWNTVFLWQFYLSGIFKVTNYLSQSEIAHNVMFAKGKNFDETIEKNTLRVYIWPRQKFIGSKDDNKKITFQLAICELSGHLVIKGKLLSNSFI